MQVTIRTKYGLGPKMQNADSFENSPTNLPPHFVLIVLSVLCKQYYCNYGQINILKYKDII